MKYSKYFVEGYLILTACSQTPLEGGIDGNVGDKTRLRGANSIASSPSA